MSTWSRPYITVAGPGRVASDWILWPVPRPLPAPPGASSDPDLTATLDTVALGIPTGSKIAVRWRAPGFTNPRKRSFGMHAHAQAVALACDVQRAADEGGRGWVADERGYPIRVQDAPTPITALSSDAVVITQHSPNATPEDATRLPNAREVAVFLEPAQGPVSITSLVPLASAEVSGPAGGPVAAALRLNAVLDPANRSSVSPNNLLLRGVAEGHLALGATVADLVDKITADRSISWTPAHALNMKSVFGFIKHCLVYAEPMQEDNDAVKAWKRARLNVPGVEEGASIHVLLLLAPDLTDAVQKRRHSDRRVELLNVQAVAKSEKTWAHYLQAVDDRASGARRPSGRMPNRPSDVINQREPAETISPRTEELFATALGTVLATAEGGGLLIGPNPWIAFAPRHSKNVGYRRPTPLAINQRNVLPIDKVVDLADAIAHLGPLDTHRNRPSGERLRALVLASVAGARPSEYAGVRPGEYRTGASPELVFARSVMPVSPAANDGEGIFTATSLKGRNPGITRTVGIPRFVADALDSHLEAGYASAEQLFTAPAGGVLRFGNLTDTYWRPAVEKVCGTSAEPLLREMEFRWLRKGAITWMMRSGKSLIEVAELVGHAPSILLAHYAGVVAGRSNNQRLWTSWDDAWDWAVKESEDP